MPDQPHTHKATHVWGAVILILILIALLMLAILVMRSHPHSSPIEAIRISAQQGPGAWWGAALFWSFIQEVTSTGYNSTPWVVVAIAIVGLLNIIITRLFSQADERQKAKLEEERERRLDARERIKEANDEIRSRVLKEEVAEKAAIVASKVEEVAIKNDSTTAATAEKLDHIAVLAEQSKAIAVDAQATGKETYVLVNSQHGNALASWAMSARALAVLTKDPKHIEEAERAEKALLDHDTQQKRVDAGKPRRLNTR